MSARAMTEAPAGLAEVEVTTVDGATLRLGSAWAEKTAALVFVRHFG